jgi:hypothetical protein
MPFGLVLRRSILLGAPLAFAVLMLFYFWPYDYYSNKLMPIAGWWTVLRTIQFVLFALMGASVWLLTDGLRRVEVFISRLGAVVFATFYNADDAIAVISTGLLARAAADAPLVERDAYIESMGTLFADPTKNLFFAVGSYAWIFALVAAAFALYRAGAPRLLLLLFAPAYFLTGDLAVPFGSLAFGSFFLAVLWLELTRRKSASERAGSPVAQPIVSEAL